MKGEGSEEKKKNQYSTNAGVVLFGTDFSCRTRKERSKANKAIGNISQWLMIKPRSQNALEIFVYDNL